MRPTSKALGTEPLRLKYEELLSKFAFKANLCRYTEAAAAEPAALFNPRA
jgi:hypothetical protein